MVRSTRLILRLGEDDSPRRPPTRKGSPATARTDKPRATSHHKQEHQLPVPDGFVCQILQEIMRDPVTTCDGHTYEREAIEEWLRRRETSPCTGLQLPSLQLTPNIGLKKAICAFKEQQPEVTRAPLQRKDWALVEKALSVVETFERESNVTNAKIARLLRENRALRGNAETQKLQLRMQAKNLKAERRAHSQEVEVLQLHLEALQAQLCKAGLEPRASLAKTMLAAPLPEGRADPSSRSCSPVRDQQEVFRRVETQRARPGEEMASTPRVSAWDDVPPPPEPAVEPVPAPPTLTPRQPQRADSSPCLVPPATPRPGESPSNLPDEVEEAKQWLVGVWHYNVFEEKANMELSARGPGQLFLDEVQPSGYRCSGLLIEEDGWFTGNVVYTNGFRAMRRVQRAEEPRTGEAVISWKRVGESGWTKNDYLHRPEPGHGRPNRGPRWRLPM